MGRRWALNSGARVPAVISGNLAHSNVGLLCLDQRPRRSRPFIATRKREPGRRTELIVSANVRNGSSMDTTNSAMSDRNLSWRRPVAYREVIADPDFSQATTERQIESSRCAGASPCPKNQTTASIAMMA